MADFQIDGTIYKIYPAKSRESGGKTYTEQSFILKTESEYNGKTYESFPSFTVKLDKTRDALTKHGEGARVSVKFTPKGVRYADKKTGEEKFFGANEVYSIYGGQNVPSNTPPTKKESATPSNYQQNSNDDSSLPF